MAQQGSCNLLSESTMRGERAPAELTKGTNLYGDQNYGKNPLGLNCFSLSSDFLEKEANGCSMPLQRDLFKILKQGFPGDSVVKSLPASVGNMGFNP